MRRWIGGGLAILFVGAALWGAPRAGGTLAFFLNLYKAYRVGQSFYKNYEHVSRNVAFHPEATPRLDVYSPSSGSDYPVLLFVHGGSWRQYHKELFAPVAMKLLPEGMVVVIPDYTLYPEAQYEQMAGEMAAALSWTLENIAQYGGDPRRVILAGHSSGAHLAGLVLMDPRFLAPYGRSGDEVCGLIGMSGVYDVQAEYDFWAAKGPSPKLISGVMGGVENLTQASPIRYVQAGLPPVLLLHGDQDETVPVSIAVDFDAALRAAGTQSELRVYGGAGHTDYLFAALSQEESRLVDDIAAFVRACTP
jgi:acetyl esterase/lipase